MATIQLQQVEKKFGDQYAVKPMDLTIRDGEFVALLGPSGCGKTTTLRMISGLETVTGGTISLDGRNVTWAHPSDRNIAFVFQFYALYPHMSARQNIVFPLQAEGMDKAAIDQRVDEVVKLLRIEALLNTRPGKLSGGDKQRIALARALVRRPAAFLMDEPLGALDAEFRETMRAEIKRLHLDIHATTVYVTHDQIEAMAMSDRIVVMSAAEVQQVGTPAEVYYDPANLFVARFIGSPGMNLITGQYAGGNVHLPGGGQPFILGGASSSLAATLGGEGNIILGFRPEAAEINPDGALTGNVYATDMHGAYTMLHLNLNENEIVHIRGDRASRYPIGTKVKFGLNPEMVRFFHPQTEKAIQWEGDMSSIELRGITKDFPGIRALNDVSFTIQNGEFFVLLGPTGAGKTTTLRIVAGLVKQDAGSVSFDGEVMDTVIPADRDVAFVFQQYSLYPTMTVFDNLAFPLRSPMRRTPEPEIRKKVEEVSQILRINHLLDRKTARLSGGEMQRVSIGRAIVREPRIFLMDEPLSNLDAKLREALRVELQHLQKTQGFTTLFVTHDQIEALTMADRIAVLSEGRIVQIGTPEDIYDRPATTFVATLVGTPRINLMKGHREGSAIFVNPLLQIPIPNGIDFPNNFQVGIRPEDVKPDSEGLFTGRVDLTEPLGVETIIHIHTGGDTLLSLVPGMTHFEIGHEVRFNITRERLHCFETEGRRIA